MSARDCIREILLSAYLDGELAAGELGKVEEHLACCPKCRTAYEGMKAERSLLLEHLGGAEPAPYVKQRLFRRIDAAPRVRWPFAILSRPSTAWVACAAMVFLAMILSVFHIQRRVENAKLLADIDRSKGEWAARGGSVNPFDIDLGGAQLRVASGNPFRSYLEKR